MTLEIISETPINSLQLKEELSKIKKRDNELNFRAAKAEEHLERLSLHKDADAVFEKISKLEIPRLKEQHMHKIIDIMPATIKDLKAAMQGYTISLSNENMKKIVDVVSTFIAKK